MIFREVALTGTARPRPTPATAVLIPTTLAWLSASAPPELPGFSAASVWITSSIRRAAEPLRVGSDRPSALTTPAVTEPASPSGLPTATTSWPTTSSSASPSLAGGGVGPAARSTARSESGSAPTVVNGTEVPSPNEAVPDCAFPTTCALVSRKPSLVYTTAEPRLSPPRLEPRWGTRRLATLPVSSAATPTTIWEYASSGDCIANVISVTEITSLQMNLKDGRLLPRAVSPLPAQPAPRATASSSWNLANSESSRSTGTTTNWRATSAIPARIRCSACSRSSS